MKLHQADKSIMQALDNLTEAQVNDFLSGRSPLMLAIHMGENTVFVQLQLSMLQGQGQRPAQPCPSVSTVTPATAAVLSQTVLSPTTLAEATRCLSQRLQRLHQMSACSPLLRPTASTVTSVTPQLCQPPVVTLPPNAPVAAASAPSRTDPSQTVFPHLQRLPNLPESSAPSLPPSPGAVINSMKHLGRGVYTGTFQGTLGPSLQDRNGQPRRSVNTILHILNDLLVAAPHSPSPSQGQTSATMQPPCQCRATSQPLTPPASPTSKNGSVTEVCLKDEPENNLLRDKMHRVQMMLAQRKEQRRTRKEISAPYTNQRAPLRAAPANVLTSLAAVRMAATTTAAATSDRTEGATHVESATEQPNAYCKSSIEQDSLAV